MVQGFTKKYNVFKLVYYEIFEDILSAITREKQIKGWLRSKKILIIKKSNPYWKDLYESIVKDSSSCGTQNDVNYMSSRLP